MKNRRKKVTFENVQVFIRNIQILDYSIIRTFLINAKKYTKEETALVELIGENYDG